MKLDHENSPFISCTESCLPFKTQAVRLFWKEIEEETTVRTASLGYLNIFGKVVRYQTYSICVTVTAPGYGAPAKLTLANVPFEISIGDNQNWNSWAQTKYGNETLVTLLWLAMRGGLMFLNARHENPLATFLNNLSP
ncbi:16889_t:CDS:2 [Funneliformis caledonium]|uniref:16889_t:CDS:1 n=1 Tax=Funneliformis caledonium TaxID=1117310 RepID=A0A9N8YX02_9GLOM|nr:16889_t:CDS:2 [Funneliformis caledonium]